METCHPTPCTANTVAKLTTRKTPKMLPQRTGPRESASQADRSRGRAGTSNERHSCLRKKFDLRFTLGAEGGDQKPLLNQLKNEMRTQQAKFAVENDAKKLLRYLDDAMFDKYHPNLRINITYYIAIDHKIGGGGGGPSMARQHAILDERVLPRCRQQWRRRGQPRIDKALSSDGMAGVYDVGAIHAIDHPANACFVRVICEELKQETRLYFDLAASRASYIRSKGVGRFSPANPGRGGTATMRTNEVARKVVLWRRHSGSPAMSVTAMTVPGR